MKYILLNITFILSIHTNVSCQNLVFNSSFEVYIQCPYSTTQLPFATGWFTTWGIDGSSEYFNSCNNGYFGVPDNAWGYQKALTGKGYAGCIFYTIGNWREYVQTKLIDSLIKDEEYCCEFYVSLCDRSKYGIEDIGMLFSNDTIKWTQLNQNYHHPQILYSNGIISDTANWVKINEKYIAQGGEQFITIGNFNINTPTNYSVVYPFNEDYAYYYIDNVIVYKCSSPVYVANTGNDTTICLGDSIQIGSLNLEQYRYVWFEPGNNMDTVSILPAPSVSPETTTTYILKVVDFKYTETTDTITITVIDCEKPGSVDVFPNPTSRELTFKFSNPIPDNTKVKFYNMLGQEVKAFLLKSDLYSKEATIFLDSFRTGIYYYILSFNDKKKFTGKVVKIE